MCIIGIATGWTSRVQFPAVQEFSLLLSVHTGSGDHPVSYPMGTWGSFPGVKEAGIWSWPVPSIRCRDQEWWSYASTPGPLLSRNQRSVRNFLLRAIRFCAGLYLWGEWRPCFWGGGGGGHLMGCEETSRFVSASEGKNGRGGTFRTRPPMEGLNGWDKGHTDT
jgi:hypothetical protein